MNSVRIAFQSGAGEIVIIQNFSLFQLSKIEREFVVGLSDYIATWESRCVTQVEEKI